jgi:[ribosomal protein S5]-alanine N-acetyltransferase
MIFETKRLYVTKWKPKDLNALHALYNDSANTEFIVPQLTIEETTKIFETQLNNYSDRFPFGRYFIVEKLSGKFIGLLLFKKNNNKAELEIGYSLIKDRWRKGYATEVVRGSIEWIFASNGISFIYAKTQLGNKNSKNVLLKCGFVSRENINEYGEEINVFSVLKNETIA